MSNVAAPDGRNTIDQKPFRRLESGAQSPSASSPSRNRNRTAPTRAAITQPHLSVGGNPWYPSIASNYSPTNVCNGWKSTAKQVSWVRHAGIINGLYLLRRRGSVPAYRVRRCNHLCGYSGSDLLAFPSHSYRDHLGSGLRPSLRLESRRRDAALATTHGLCVLFSLRSRWMLTRSLAGPCCQASISLVARVTIGSPLKLPANVQWRRKQTQSQKRQFCRSPPAGPHHPHVLPRFCSSSHLVSGAK
jgi:hypothetical protein